MGVSAQHNKIHLAIAAWEWPSYFDPAQKMKGIRLDIAEYRRPDPATAPSTAKAAGLYMICTISKHQAERKGYADALMLDWQGRVAECTGANVFFIRGRRHPHADRRLLPRRHHAPHGDRPRQAPRLRGRASGASCRRSSPSFNECFITGTAAEVTPVSEIGPHTLQARQHDQGADGGLFGRGAAEGQGGRVAAAVAGLRGACMRGRRQSPPFRFSGRCPFAPHLFALPYAKGRLR